MEASRQLGYSSMGVIRGMVARKELRNFAAKVKNGHRQKYLLKRAEVEAMRGALNWSGAC